MLISKISNVVTPDVIKNCLTIFESTYKLFPLLHGFILTSRREPML